MVFDVTAALSCTNPVERASVWLPHVTPIENTAKLVSFEVAPIETQQNELVFDVTLIETQQNSWLLMSPNWCLTSPL